MRIAQVSPRYHPYIGGVETYVMEISERLLKRDFEVEVLTTDPSGKLPREERINDVNVKRFGSWNFGSFSGELGRYLAKNSGEYDIVHAYSYHDFPALHAAEAKCRNKLVFNPAYHGTGHTWFRKLLHLLYKFIGRKIFLIADKVICFSNYERSLILEHFKCDGEKVSVIPCGVELESKYVQKRSKDYSTILYAGRLEEYKGVDYLVKILPMLNNNIILDVHGKGPYKERLLRLARKLRVENRVRLFQDTQRLELLEEYANADLFILLSRYESYGISVAEALAAGTPCIVANTSALREWVDGKNCFGIDYPIDLSELKNLINNVIGKEVRELNRSKLWDWSDTVREVAKVYEDVC